MNNYCVISYIISSRYYCLSTEPRCFSNLIPYLSSELRINIFRVAMVTSQTSNKSLSSWHFFCISPFLIKLHIWKILWMMARLMKRKLCGVNINRRYEAQIFLCFQFNCCHISQPLLAVITYGLCTLSVSFSTTVWTFDELIKWELIT